MLVIDNKNCRYGKRCIDLNPNKCFYILNSGACEDKSCDKIHPELWYQICQEHCNRKQRVNTHRSRLSCYSYEAYNNCGYVNIYHNHGQYYNQHFQGSS